MSLYCSRVISPRAYWACKISLAAGYPVECGAVAVRAPARRIVQAASRAKPALNPSQAIRIKTNPAQPHAPKLLRDPQLPKSQKASNISYLLSMIRSEIFILSVRFNLVTLFSPIVPLHVGRETNAGREGHTHCVEGQQCGERNFVLTWLPCDSRLGDQPSYFKYQTNIMPVLIK